MADRAQLRNDQEEAMRLMMDGRQANLWTALPAIVTSVNWDDMTCECQPAIQGAVQDENGAEQFVDLPLLVDVPITFPSGGGFLITFPIVEDDEVLVVLASRCIDAWWQSGGVQKPVEMRMHDLSDGFAIPGPRSKPRVVTGISETALQIRNDAGASYIEIAADGKIKVHSPSTIRLEGNTTVQGTLTVSQTITGQADMQVQTNIQAGGDLVAEGQITAGTDVIVAATGVHLNTHKHISAAPGSPTGPAIP